MYTYIYIYMHICNHTFMCTHEYIIKFRRIHLILNTKCVGIYNIQYRY